MSSHEDKLLLLESPRNSGSLAIGFFPGMADPHRRILERARILVVLVSPLTSQVCFLAAAGSRVSAEPSLEPSGLWPPSPGEPGSRGRDPRGGRFCSPGEGGGQTEGGVCPVREAGRMVRPVV